MLFDITYSLHSHPPPVHCISTTAYLICFFITLPTGTAMNSNDGDDDDEECDEEEVVVIITSPPIYSAIAQTLCQVLRKNLLQKSLKKLTFIYLSGKSLSYHLKIGKSFRNAESESASRFLLDVSGSRRWDITSTPCWELDV